MIPTTCPVLTHEGADLYFRCLRLHTMLSRGHLSLGDVSSVMYDLAYYVSNLEAANGDS